MIPPLVYQTPFLFVCTPIEIKLASINFYQIILYYFYQVKLNFLNWSTLSHRGGFRLLLRGCLLASEAGKIITLFSNESTNLFLNLIWNLSPLRSYFIWSKICFLALAFIDIFYPTRLINECIRKNLTNISESHRYTVLLRCRRTYVLKKC